MSGGLPVECPHCGYGVASGAEAVESLEAGGQCPMCGEAIPPELLAAAAEAWTDAEAMAEGAARARDAAEESEEEEWLNAGPDFGDDGEEDEEEEER